jgi:hypothetical protein
VASTLGQAFGVASGVALGLVEQSAVNGQSDVVSDMLQRRQFMLGELTRPPIADMEDAEQVISDKERNPGGRADTLAQEGVDRVKGGEIGHDQWTAGGGNPAGEALANGNNDFADGFLFQPGGGADKESLAVRDAEEDRDVLYAHDVFDGAEQRGEERIEVKVSDSFLGQGVAEIELARLIGRDRRGRYI